jgi:hypothetical protein
MLVKEDGLIETDREKPMQKITSKLVIVIALAVLALAAVTLLPRWTDWTDIPPENTSNNNAVAPPSDEQPDDALSDYQKRVAGWQLYRNEELGFALRYPPGYRVRLNPISSGTMQRIKTSPELEFVGTFFLESDSIESDILESRSEKMIVSVEMWTNPKGLSLDEWFHHKFPGMDEYFRIEKVNIAGTDLLQWRGDDPPPTLDNLVLQESLAFLPRLRLSDPIRDVQFEPLYYTIIESLLRES